MTRRDAASERQVQAAHPGASTWLAANAGSGKTRVLTDRVARLLLAGTQPQNILCLTYTKAAASEMQNRLFKRLGAWAMQPDAKLEQALGDLGVDGKIDGAQLSRARTLFARAIETPGGLKIQTIHSFCASLLRRFPLEAGVSPQFTEVEDRATALLRTEIIETFSDGPQAGLIRNVATYVADDGLVDVTRAITQNRHAFETPLDWPQLAKIFGVSPTLTEDDIIADVMRDGTLELIRDILPVLFESGGNNAKAAVKLREIAAANIDALEILESVVLHGPTAKEPFSAKTGSFPTKATRNGPLAARIPEIDDLISRVETARPLRIGLASARKSLALHRYAAAFLPEYAHRKQLRGWLDFDDLILKARQLLNDPSVAAWVLYRLDGGIDHVLVDEAQDTSPEQWDVIEKLAQELTSGEGARGHIPRTIFVVGDKKQSIYSFQGADPDAFDRMQREFGARLGNSGSGLHSLTLEHSFRSSDAILRLVDLVFEGQSAAGFHADARHLAFMPDLPGRVDLWPVVSKVEDKDDRPWSDPVDRRGQHDQNVILAKRIASAIRKMIDDKTTIPSGGPGQKPARRPVRAGDFLILVQRRGPLFAEVIRACKAAELPIAGADRLKVGAELAVKDLAALLSFLSTPEDDLSLANALKSPLFGWDEQALFDLAHKRTELYLWQALRARSAEYPRTMAVLVDLMGQTDFLRPYDLIERILTRHDGRKALLGRLGPEAEDGINALLSQALAYERSDIPSLTGFLAWMQTDDLEIKRQMGSAGNMIRVMTVHGAKGLESPIVILPDTGKRRPPPDGQIVMADNDPLWRMSQTDSPETLSQAKQAARDRQMNERMRLLYVALTRAEKWLIVTAAGDLDKGGDTWYQRVEAAMHSAGAIDAAFEGGKGLSLIHGDWTSLPLEDPTEPTRAQPPLPGHFRNPAPPATNPAETLSPSDLGGAKALPGEAGLDEATALARGSQIHLLLEHLPRFDPVHRADAAGQLLPDLPEAVRDRLTREVGALLDIDALAPIFTPDALVEVPVTATIGGRRMHGTIDRLIIYDTSVLAVDFKTNAIVPPDEKLCPEGVLRQMGAYALALSQIFPDHEIETAVLWTACAKLMPLPHDLVTDALWRSPRLDGIKARS